MADGSFIDKLRMNGIFPQGGGGYAGAVPFGMPDLSRGNVDVGGAISQIYPLISQEKERDRQLQLQLAGMKQGGQLGDIGMQMTGHRLKSEGELGHVPDTSKMNYVYREDPNKITPYQQATLDLRKEEMQQRGQLGRGRLDLSEQDVATRSRRADIAQKIAEGRATDEEKQEWAMDRLREGERIGDERLTTRGTQQTGLQTLRGTQASERQKVEGTQNLAEIAKRQEGAMELQANKPETPMLPSQQRVAMEDKARQLVNMNPKFAKFITIAPDGSFRVRPPATGGYFGTSGPTPEEHKQINDFLYAPTQPTPKPTTPVKPTTKPGTTTPAKTTAPKTGTTGKFSYTIKD